MVEAQCQTLQGKLRKAKLLHGEYKASLKALAARGDKGHEFDA